MRQHHQQPLLIAPDGQIACSCACSAWACNCNHAKHLGQWPQHMRRNRIHSHLYSQQNPYPRIEWHRHRPRPASRPTVMLMHPQPALLTFAAGPRFPVFMAPSPLIHQRLRRCACSVWWHSPHTHRRNASRQHPDHSTAGKCTLSSAGCPR